MRKIAFALTALFASQLVYAVPTDCGEWISYQVEVCDEREIITEKPITHCRYISLPIENRQFTKTVDGHISYPQCGRMNGYYLNEVEHTTKQVRTVVKENCRMETRWEWVPGGPNCGDIPLATPKDQQ